MSSWDESRGTPARLTSQPEPFFFGPICLVSVAAWLLTVAAWIVAPTRPIPASVAEQLTQSGKMYYRPENDLPIYLGGLALAVLVGLASGGGWRRWWLAAVGDVGRSRIERQANWNVWWALGCLAIATISPQNLMLNALAAGFAACAAVVVWANAKPRTSARHAAPLSLKTATAPGAASTGNATDNAKASAGAASAAGSNPVAADTPASEAQSRFGSGFWWATAAAAAIIGILIYVPDPATLEARTWLLDGLMHWNYYLMGPLLAYRHGAALGTDIYTQYSVGWPLFFSSLAWVSSVDYRLVLEAVTLWGCIYFMMLFWFLRSLTGSTAWAIAGLLLALLLQMFCGTEGPLWMYPSSTILRNPLDVPLFWLCLLHTRSGNSRYGIGIGCVGGLAVLFATDTGVYTVAALLFYCALCTGYRPHGRNLFNAAFIAKIGGTFFAIAIVGLTWASRGTLLQPDFWIGYWEPLLFYSGGISALPMHGGIAYREDFLLLMAALLAYSFALTSAILRWFTGRLEAADLVLALIAAFGLETLMVFINRSHPFNIYHPIIPFCLLAIAYAARWAQIPERRRPTVVAARYAGRFRRTATPVALIGILLICLAFNQQVREYPSLLTTVLPKPREGRNDVSLRAESDSLRTDLRLLANIVRSLSEGGRHSVALVDPRDTNVLAMADVPPYFRYSPLDPLHYRQVDIIRQRLRENPPDIILFAIFGTPEMADIRRELEREQYAVDGQQGIWRVLRRIDRAKTGSGDS